MGGYRTIKHVCGCICLVHFTKQVVTKENNARMLYHSHTKLVVNRTQTWMMKLLLLWNHMSATILAKYLDI